MTPSASFDTLLEGLLAPLESGSLALTICDATELDMPIVRVNPAFCALTGFPEHEVIGRNCRFLQGPGTDPAATARLREAVHRGEAARVILLNYRRDRSTFLNEVIISPVRDHAGKLRYYTAVQREVVDGHMGLVRPIRFALLPDATIRELSSADHSGAGWLDEMPTSARRRLAHAAAYVAAAGPSQRRLSIKIDKMQSDGIIRSEHLLADATHDREAVIFEGALSETAQDAVLLDRLRLLEAVASSVNDGIIITEAEPLDYPGPKIVYCNEAVTRTSGWSLAELVGRSPRVFQGEDTDRATRTRLGKKLRQWQPVAVQLLNYRRDKSKFWIDLSIVPIHDQYGWWTNWVAIQRDETERRADADHIAFQAMHDPLTGLANRRKIYACFDDNTRGEVEAETTYSVVHVDLDHFKAINDGHGHAAGDAVLVETARRLNNSARHGDLVSRIGGDEFLILLPSMGSEAALASAAERFQTAVSGPFLWNDLKLSISASVGAALFEAHGRTLDELMAASDIALYNAKQQGRGCARVFSRSVNEDAMTARGLGGALGVGLERGEFEVVFQPQISTVDLRVVGLEALIRWRHPQRGLLSPGAFLPAAAEAGMTAKLDNCVALQAFQAASRWCTLGLSFGRVAINLSSESISDPKLVKRLTGHLAHARLASAYTTVEMVESVFFDHGAHDVAGQLAALRELGMTVDLDDFGTGFASLTHLRRFPVDRIKIDRSFVAGIGNSPGYDVIVSAIVKLGASLGLECVAEGVETPMQFKFLAELGCHCVQGYFFARPMSEHATTMWLTHYDDYRSEFQRALAVDSVSLTTPDNAQIDFVS